MNKVVEAKFQYIQVELYNGIQAYVRMSVLGRNIGTYRFDSYNDALSSYNLICKVVNDITKYLKGV